MAIPRAVGAPARDEYTLLAMSAKPALSGTFADLAIYLKKTMSNGVMTSAVAALETTDAIRTLIKA